MVKHSCVHCMVSWWSWWYPMLTFSSIACTQSAWAGETVTNNHQNITKVNSSSATEVGVRCPKSSPGWLSLPLSQPAVRCGAHRWQAATAQEPAAWDQSESNIWNKTGLQISQVLVIRITQQIMLGRTKHIMKYHFFIECVSKAIADCCRLRLSPSSFTWSLLSAGAILWRVLLYMRWEQWHNGMRLWPTVLMSYDVLFQI